MAKDSNTKLAIIDETVDNNFINEDTVTIQSLPFEKMNDLIKSNMGCIVPFRLLNGWPLVLNVYVNFIGSCPTVDIKIGGSITNQYKFSLYHLNEKYVIVKDSTIYVDNVKPRGTVRLRASDTFKIVHTSSQIGVDTNVINKNFIFYIKVSRMDIPAVLHLNRITDCSLLFENNALTNCRIIVENREFRVHKEILAAKSTVFLAMFENEMKEKKENQVTIEDIEGDVFCELLRYFYKNTVNNINVHAQKLFMAADKYDVPKLKSDCIDGMLRSLELKNAVGVLMFADLYNVNILKVKAMQFIKDQIKSVLQTKEFKTLYKSKQAHLLNEILEAVV